ncbi:guanylate kinase [Clostridium transplantifaecale]|uniref:guanylate kinase n=1 Tax=Clostridium transplantifaecale TaxID=2479838 RepID=UPI000F63BCE4|nr:guanylate kinase [Clostridium transplantifaecale]
MGKIFYVMGKSASGKDTIYKKLLERLPGLKTVVTYTTRPIRDGETEGVEYHFTTAGQLEQFQREGKLIEIRTYDTVFGPWSYSTVNDGQINLAEDNYLMIGTLESYRSIREYFGADKLVPLYIQVEDGERLTRALEREKQQKQPKYAELCRRFLADEEDFSEEKLEEAGIEKRYVNSGMEKCLSEIAETITTLTQSDCSLCAQ